MDLSSLFSQDIVSGLTAAVSIASAVSTILPAPKSDGTYKAVYNLFQWIGCNFGKAKNAQDQPKSFTFER